MSFVVGTWCLLIALKLMGVLIISWWWFPFMPFILAIYFCLFEQPEIHVSYRRD